MAWVTASKGEYWVVKSEALTVATHTAKASTSFTVPPGIDFLVGLYHASTASGTCSIDIYGSMDNSTFALLKTVTSDSVTAATIKVANYDISANGEAPYYKFYINPNASVSDTTLAYTAYVAFHRRELGKDY